MHFSFVLSLLSPCSFPYRPVPKVQRQPSRRPRYFVATANAQGNDTLPLPWQDDSHFSRGMLTTSFETCTVTESENPTPYHLRVGLDTAVTCTALQYRRAGQWVFCKPWGDEDGNIEACPLSHNPDGRSEFDVYVRAAGELAAAVENGEMLEVSEVMGAGFPEPTIAAISTAREVWAFAAAESLFSLRPLLESVSADANVRIFVLVAGDDVREFEEFYEIETGDVVNSFGGASAELFSEWFKGLAVSVTTYELKAGIGFGELAAHCGTAPGGTVALLVSRWEELREKLRQDCGVEEEHIFSNG